MKFQRSLFAPLAHAHRYPPCAAQMQFSLHGALNASAEIADAANRPLIRLFTVGQGGGMSDSAPLRDFTSIEQN